MKRRSIVGQPCRLCFTFGRSHIQIFNESIKIVETIQEIFHCEVSEFDLLPNCVCVDCWMTTEKFHKFYQQVKLAQNEWLLQAIVKTELVNDDPTIEPWNERDKTALNQATDVFAAASFLNVDFPPCGTLDTVKLDNDKNTLDTDTKKDIVDISQPTDNLIVPVDVSDNILTVKKLDPLDQVESIIESEHEEQDESDSEDGDFEASSSQNQTSESESSENDSIEDDSEIDSSYGKKRKTKVSFQQSKLHKKQHSQTRKHLCNDCGKFFYRADRLRIHTELKHSHKCNVCNIGFPSEQKLAGHLKTHDKDFAQILKEKLEAVDLIDPKTVSDFDKNEIILKHSDKRCEICKIRIESLQHAKSHYMTEHNTLGYIRCCNLILRDEHHIKEHVLLHLNPELFRCIICEETMKSKASLKSHLNSHAEESGFSCDVCQQRFFNRNSLRKHIINRHATTKETFSCKFCEKSYLDTEQLERHMRTKHDTVPFSSEEKEKMLELFDLMCDICETRFESLQNAKAHYWDDHNDPNGYIKCCETKFKTIDVVKEHISWHFDPDVFKCNLCGRVHKNKHNLMSHLSTHKYKYAHICDECGEAFSRREALDAHKRKHGLECKFCHNRFQTKNRLEAHLKTHDKDGQQKIKEAIEAVNEIDTDNVSATEIQEIILKHFDMTCDICKVNVESLDQAKAHYLNEHNTAKAYVKCCGMKLRDEMVIKEHVVYHFKPEQFRCFICDELVKVKNHLKLHLLNHTSENRRMRCSCAICGKNFNFKAGLASHIARRHTESQNQFKCKFCDKFYLLEDQLDRHMRRMHELISAEKNEIVAKHFDMMCDECGIRLESLLHAQQHYLQEHNNPNGYIKCCEIKFKSLALMNDHIDWHRNPHMNKCEICGKEFKMNRHLKAHMYTHTVSFACDLCHKKFKCKSTLKLHCKNVHENPERHFPCRFCTLRFATEEKLNTHEQLIHYRSTTEASIMCEICGKGFTQDGNLRKHMRNNHSEKQLLKASSSEEREKCTICGLWLPNRYRLKIHRKLHKLEPHKCDQCDLVAPNQEALLCHIRAFHKDRRKHKCRLCDQSFANGAELQKHASSHAGENLYQCNHCTDAFIWRASLTAHKKKSHPMEYGQEKAVRAMKIK